MLRDDLDATTVQRLPREARGADQARRLLAVATRQAFNVEYAKRTDGIVPMSNCGRKLQSGYGLSKLS